MTCPDLSPHVLTFHHKILFSRVDFFPSDGRLVIPFLIAPLTYQQFYRVLPLRVVDATSSPLESGLTA